MKQIINITGLLVVLNFFSSAQDTLIIEEKPVPLNYTEVMQSLSWPKENPCYEGKVYIKILIGINGEVESLGEISGPDIFYNEVRKAAVKFIFAPVQVNGRPVRVIVTFPFTFRIQE